MSSGLGIKFDFEVYDKYGTLKQKEGSSEERILLEYRWQQHDPEGNLVEDTGFVPCHSLLRNFLELLLCQWSQANQTGVTNTGGTSRTLQPDLHAFDSTGAAAASDRGLVVGSGTNVVDIGNTALQTQIAHGTGATQLLYGATTFTGYQQISSTEMRFTFSRIFTNDPGSAGNITVEEIALYALAASVAAGATEYFCIMRERITRTITNGNTATLTWSLRTTGVATIALFRIFETQMTQADTTTTVNDTGGTGRLLRSFGIAGAIRNLDGEIRLGRDATPAVYASTLTDFSTEVTDGSGANQLVFQSDVFSPISISGQNGEFNDTRTFLNSSGVAVIVYQAGTYCQCMDNGNTLRTFLTTYHVPGVALTVSNDDVLVVRAVLSI